MEHLDHKSDFSLRCSQDRLLPRSPVSCAQLTVQQWWMGGLLPVKACEFVGIPGLTSSTASHNHQGKTGWHVLSKLQTSSSTVLADSGYSLFLLQEVNLRRVIGFVSKIIIFSKFMFSTFPLLLSKAIKKKNLSKERSSNNYLSSPGTRGGQHQPICPVFSLPEIFFPCATI